MWKEWKALTVDGTISPPILPSPQNCWSTHLEFQYIQFNPPFLPCFERTVCLWLIQTACLTDFRIYKARIVPLCLYQANSTTHLSRLRSFIGIYSGRYVKWRTPDRDGILVLAEQIKQIKIQIAPQDVSHALTSQWPPSGSCDRFRDLFLYCPPPTQAPVLTVFRICFYLNPTAKNIFECCAPRRGVLFGVFSKNCDYLQ